MNINTNEGHNYHTEIRYGHFLSCHSEFTIVISFLITTAVRNRLQKNNMSKHLSNNVVRIYCTQELQAFRSHETDVDELNGWNNDK
jgi:hypothetical protein